jgi:hypothetical protein
MATWDILDNNGDTAFGTYVLEYDANGTPAASSDVVNFNPDTVFDVLTDSQSDTTFAVGDPISFAPVNFIGGPPFASDTNGAYQFAGSVIHEGKTFLFIEKVTDGGYLAFTNDPVSSPDDFPRDVTPTPTGAGGDFITSNFTVCFCAGSLIATPAGETAVEHLKIGDLISTQDGRNVPVLWIGRQTVVPNVMGPRGRPVRITRGALGKGLPHTDLLVTADHGMIIDGYVINAAALINGTTIHTVAASDVPRTYTVYHIETAQHDVILANGAPTETFIDAAGRTAFDNFDEYMHVYGAERIIPEMPRPRISAARLVPEAIKRRLGLNVPEGISA